MLTDFERFSEFLRLDEVTGKLYWIKKSGSRGVRGQRVGYVDSNDYLLMKFQGKAYKVHRVVWLLYTGNWPIQVIDHINNIKKDNRPCNLRDVSPRENSLNTVGFSASGYKGVHEHWPGRFRARIEQRHLGTFGSKQEAADAIKKELTDGK